MIFRYVFSGLLLLLLVPIGWVFYLFIYPIFDWVYKKKVIPYWWFINSDEPTLFENKFGAIWWQKEKKIKLDTWYRKFLASYRWNAIRNPVYSMKTYVLRPYDSSLPKLNLKVYWNTTQFDGLEFCDKTVRGIQLSTFDVWGKKQFRFSATFRTLWWYTNFQFGMNDFRYLYKIRLWSKKDMIK